MDYLIRILIRKVEQFKPGRGHSIFSEQELNYSIERESLEGIRGLCGGEVKREVMMIFNKGEELKE